MLSTKYGMFKTSKVEKIIFMSLVRNQTCRQESIVLLQEQSPGKILTDQDIDKFIKDTLIPSCIEDGTAQRMVERYIELKAEMCPKK